MISAPSGSSFFNKEKRKSSTEDAASKSALEAGGEDHPDLVDNKKTDSSVAGLGAKAYSVAASAANTASSVGSNAATTASAAGGWLAKRLSSNTPYFI